MLSKLYSTLGKKSLNNLIKHYSINGAIPRQHGNTGRKPKHALKFEDVENADNFIIGYADEHGIPLAAAQRGRDDEPPVYLPCDDTKAKIHLLYKTECDKQDSRKMEYHSVTNIWNSCCPHIKISQPKDDVCQKCELLRKQIMDALREDEKLKAIEEVRAHIECAQRERQVYKDCVKKSLEELHLINRTTILCNALCNKYNNVHYTFDFSQSVGLPHHARQMGPLYFLSLKKVHVFGFRIDDRPTQYNYLIGEDETLGADGTKSHGPDTVISLVHHGLTNYGYGEQCCILHADNCFGQNKNRYVLAYFAWRVLRGLHHQITYLMQIPGHTKCLVDAGFARTKKLFRRTDCDCVEDVKEVFDSSCESNVGILYRNEDQTNNWKYYDWKTYLIKYFESVPRISKYYSFRFDTNTPGHVHVKETSESEETAIRSLKKTEVDNLRRDFPKELQPSGLTMGRSTYLYRKVRPYVRVRCQDKLCPPPVEA